MSTSPQRDRLQLAAQVGPSPLREDQESDLGQRSSHARSEQESEKSLRAIEQENTTIRLAREGDHQAMTTLLNAYQSRVFGICYRMVGHYEDASDLTQDVLTRMLTNISDFDQRAAFSTWVYRIAVNASISHLRKRKTLKNNGLRPTGGSGQSGNPLDSLPGSRSGRELSASSGVEKGESRGQLQAAMLSLTEEARALLVLRDVRDLDYERISEILGLPLGTVKSRLFRARLALRKAIQRMEVSRRASSYDEQGTRMPGSRV